MSNYTDFTKLVLWCRKNGIAWGHLTVGNIEMDGTDMRSADEAPKKDAPAAKRQSIADKYGAGLLTEAAESEGMNSVVEEDD